MDAVCRTEHFAETIRARPAVRDRLLAIEPAVFIHAMRTWRELFAAGADMPLVGVSESDLRSIQAPVCLIPGDDLTHLREAALNAAKFLPNCEVHGVAGETQNLDVSSPEEWRAREGEIVRIFTDFLVRKLPPPSLGADAATLSRVS